MSASDFDAEQFKLRTARKEHACQLCDTPIRAGERYIEYLGETPAYQSGKRYHERCLLEQWRARVAETDDGEPEDIPF